MRVALIAPSALPIPPPAYGGAELFVAELPEALAAPEAGRVPLVMTVHHARIERLVEAYAAAPRAALVAVSRRQAELHRELAFARVIRHGLDPSSFAAGEGRGGYVAFLGRIGPEKAPHVAIDAARRAGVPVRIARIGRIDRRRCRARADER